MSSSAAGPGSENKVLLTSEFDYSEIAKASAAAAAVITDRVGGAATQVESQLKNAARSGGGSWVDMFTGVAAAARTTTGSLANEIPAAAGKATAALQNTATLGGGSLKQQLQGASQSVAVLTQSFAVLGVEAPRGIFGVTAALSNLLRTGFNPVTLAIAGATAAIGFFAARQSDAAKAAEETTAALQEQRQAFLDLVDAAQRAEFARARPGLASGLVDIQRQVEDAESKLDQAQLGLAQAERDGAPLWVARAKRSMEEAKAALNTVLMERDLIERRIRAEEEPRPSETPEQSARRLAEVRALLERERGPSVEPIDFAPIDMLGLMPSVEAMREAALELARQRDAMVQEGIEARNRFFAEADEALAGVGGESAFNSPQEIARAMLEREQAAHAELVRLRAQNSASEREGAGVLTALRLGGDPETAAQEARVELAREDLALAQQKGEATAFELEVLREILRHEEASLELTKAEIEERAKLGAERERRDAAAAIGKAGAAEFLGGIKEGLLEGNIKPALDGLRNALTDTILDAFLTATLQKPLESIFGDLAGLAGLVPGPGGAPDAGAGAGAGATGTGSAVAGTGVVTKSASADDRKLSVVVDMSGAADVVARRMSAEGARVIVVRANEGRGVSSRKGG